MRGGGEGSRIVANKGHLFWEFFVEPRHRDDSRIFFFFRRDWNSGIEMSSSSFIFYFCVLPPSLPSSIRRFV